ncbi:hypothetical protein IE077_002943 [Cardiosporidium cionae]|uniref:NudC domain-containing protein 1 n=1 Tax=Cardiosporidium cionae TaxID=476202 RepID=A0ABQ7JF97_9APIC|nr:hypothetical protein IE077_002943 [Cardiosporidium cionae]|eukprot:KAF8822707.1 hypothetical protein IE077_002943 [Cardiosporidium cionae]
MNFFYGTFVRSLLQLTVYLLLIDDWKIQKTFQQNASAPLLIRATSVVPHRNVQTLACLQPLKSLPTKDARAFLFSRENLYNRLLLLSFPQGHKWRVCPVGSGHVKNAFLKPILPLSPWRNVWLSHTRSRRCSRRQPLVARGFGQTPHYAWKETDDGVEVRLKVKPSIVAKHIQANFSPKSINILYEARENLTLLDGRLRGEIAPSESFWWINSDEEQPKIVTFWLQKAKSRFKEWMGVIEGENILQIAYDASPGKPARMNSPTETKRLPNAILWKHLLDSTVDTATVCSWLHAWCLSPTESSTSMGLPALQLRALPFDLPNGVRLILEGVTTPTTEPWEAEDWMDLRVVEEIMPSPKYVTEKLKQKNVRGVA